MRQEIDPSFPVKIFTKKNFFEIDIFDLKNSIKEHFVKISQNPIFLVFGQMTK